MVRASVLAVLGLGIAATTAGAQETAKAPTGLPPEFVTVVAMDKTEGVLELGYSIVRKVEHIRVKYTYVADDGSTRTVEFISPKPVYEQRVLKLKLKNAEVFEPSGRKLGGEEVWERLDVGATVVIPVDGKTVDSAYLRALAKDTLVFVSWQCATWRRNIPSNASISEPPPPASPSVDQEPSAATAPPSNQQIRYVENSLGMKLALVPAGKFRMGSNSGRLQPWFPAHDVTISKAFYIGTTEVTQSQWQAVMGTTPWKGEAVYHPKEGPDYPACNINPIQAAEFCKRLSAKEGKTYRLPTEAEWEYACRAGTTTPYSFGHSESINDYAWTELNAFRKKGEQFPHKVGQKKPNPWGLYDMHGNVSEWCSDYWGDYPNKPMTDPTGPKKGEYQVYRGGSWYGNIWVCKSVSRGGGMPLDVPGEQVDNGFRVVCVPSQPVKKAAQPDPPHAILDDDGRDMNK